MGFRFQRVDPVVWIIVLAFALVVVAFVLAA
jgi:hypothetical protein